MKNLYIPKGKSLHYENLSCQNIVNDGVLVVEHTLHARNISGKGFLDAGTISARHVAALDIDCATIVGETLSAESVCAAEVTLSGPAVVSRYLEAEYVETPKLTVGKSKIGTLHAGDVINLPEKKWGITSALAAGFFRRLWLSLTCRIPVDAAYVPAQPQASEDARDDQDGQTLEQAFAGVQTQPAVQAETVTDGLADDFEFKRLKALYCLLKDCGYTLRIFQREEATAFAPECGRDTASFPDAA